jgi:hypothetical protein
MMGGVFLIALNVASLRLLAHLRKICDLHSHDRIIKPVLLFVLEPCDDMTHRLEVLRALRTSEDFELLDERDCFTDDRVTILPMLEYSIVVHVSIEANGAAFHGNYAPRSIAKFAFIRYIQFRVLT